MTRAYNTATTQQNSGGAVNPFVAGKNKIINGDFGVNQRNFTSNTADAAFSFDRWFQSNTGGTNTVTPQTFTPGTAPVAGYEGRTFLQAVTASQTGTTYATLNQRIENVRTFAGQTVTLSFWAKASSGTPKVAFEWQQDFGTGGSPSSPSYGGRQNVTLSTSWARYSITTTVDSLSGKTIGTNNNDCLRVILWYSASSEWNTNTNSIGTQNNTFQFWGFQIEAGSIATPFQTATGTIQGELAACQRYFQRFTGGSAYGSIGTGFADSASSVDIQIPLKVTMRTALNAAAFSTLRLTDYQNSVTIAGSTYPSNRNTPNVAYINFTAQSSTATQYRPYALECNNDATGYFEVSAEL